MARVVVDYIEAEPVMHEHKATHLEAEPSLNAVGDGEIRTVDVSGTKYAYWRIGGQLYRVQLTAVAIDYTFTFMDATEYDFQDAVAKEFQHS